MSGCGSPSNCATSKRVIWLGRVAGLDAVGESADGALSLGAGVTLTRRRAAARRDSPRFRRIAASFRLGAGARERNRRRQYRQRLADRRSRAGPDRAWRQGRAAQRRDDPRAAAGGLLHRLRQAGPGAGEFVLAVEAPRLAAGQHYRAFKVSKRFDEDISAVMLAARIDVDGTAHRRRAHRLRRHGGDAETRRQSRAGARSARASTSLRAGAPLRRARTGFRAADRPARDARPIA